MADLDIDVGLRIQPIDPNSLAQARKELGKLGASIKVDTSSITSSIQKAIAQFNGATINVRANVTGLDGKGISSSLQRQMEQNARMAARMNNTARRGGGSSLDAAADDALAYQKALAQIATELARLEMLQDKVSNNKDVFSLEQITKFESEIKRLQTQLNNLFNSRGSSGKGLAGEVSLLARERTALNAQVNAARSRTRSVAESGADGMDYLTRNTDKANIALRAQQNILRDLQYAIINTFSIYAVQGFLRSIVEIGGEFEKQHIALQSILGDFSSAENIFENIKALAVESPFSFKELTADTKQLAAFQVPYNELYETTKRLADISAGVGVDMGRLILAYGQVRSAAFLRGQELRQFTEAGIPMVDALAKKLSEVNRRAVSTGEVFEMISEKQVPFQYVKDVLWEMTDEGGKFYNMQEKLADSIAGKWSNLGDAYDIMLADMANGTNGFIKGFIDTLRSVMENWKTLFRVMAAALATKGINSIKGGAAFGMSGMSNFKQVQATALQNKQIEAALIRQKKLYTDITAEEQIILNTKREITAEEYRSLIAKGKLTKEEFKLAYAAGLVNEEIAKAVLGEDAIRGVKRVGLLTRAFGGLGLAAEKAWIAIKSMTTTLLSMAVFTGIFELIAKFKEFNQKITETRDNLIQTLDDMRSKLKETLNTITDQNGEIIISARLDIAQIESDIEQIQQRILDLDPLGGTFLNYAKNESGFDRGMYRDMIANRLKQLEEWSGSEYAEIMGNAKAFGIEGSVPWKGIFFDDIEERLEDYKSSFTNLSKSIVKHISFSKDVEREFRKEIGDIDWDSLGTYTQEIIKKEFPEYLLPNGTVNLGDLAKNADIDKLGRLVAELNELRNNMSWGANSPVAFMQDAAHFYKQAIGTQSALQEFANNAMKNFPTEAFVGGVRASFSDTTLGELKGELNDLGKYMFAEIIKPWQERGWLSDNYSENFLSALGIEFEEFTKENLTSMQRTVHEVLKNAGMSEMELDGVVDSTVSTMKDLGDRINKARKAWKEQQEKAEIVRLHFKFMPEISMAGLTNLSKVNPEQLQNALNKETNIWRRVALQMAIKEITSYQQKLDASKVVMEALGITEEDDTSTKDKGSKGGSKSDPVAKMWKKRVEAIDKAVAAYDKWKKVVGAEKANARIVGNKDYAKLFNGDWGFRLDLENPENAYREIINILNKNGEDLEKKHPERFKLLVRLKAAIEDSTIKDATSQIDTLYERLQKEMDNRSKEWDIYKSLFADTGNSGLSYRTAFGDKVVKNFRDRIEMLKGEFDNAMKIIAEKNPNMGFEGLTYSSLSDATALDDSFLENDNIPQKAKDLFIKIRQSIEEFRDNESKLLADMVKDWRTAADSVTSIYAKLGDDLLRIQNSSLSEMEKKRMIAWRKSLAEVSVLKQSAAYDTLFDNTLALSMDEAKGLVTTTMNVLKRGFDNNAVSAEELAKAYEDVDKALSSLSDKASSDKMLSFFGDYGYTKKDELMSVRTSAIKGESEARAKGNIELANSFLEIRNDADEALKKILEYEAATRKLNRIGTRMTKFADIMSNIFDVFKKASNSENIGVAVFGSLIDSVSAIGSTMEKIDLSNGFFTLDNMHAVSAGVSQVATAIQQINDAVSQKQERSWQAEVESIKSLISLYDDLIAHKKEYIEGSESTLNESISTIISSYELEIESIRNLAEEQITAWEGWIGQGKNKTFAQSLGKEQDHSDSYDLWRGRKDFKYSWKSIAKEIESITGKSFNSIMDLFNMSSEDLYTLQEKYTEWFAELPSYFVEQLNEYRDKIKELEKYIEFEKYESVVLFSFDDLKDEYRSLLVDMSSDTEDFADNIEEKLRNAIINAVMNNEFKSKIEGLYALMGESGADGEWTVAESNAIKNAAQELSDEMIARRDALAEAFGWTEDSASNLSSSITGITEQTADLLASYLNAIRMDVSVIRSIDELYLGTGEGSISAIAQSQLTSLRSIQANVDLIRQSNDSISNAVSELQSDFVAVLNNTKQIHIA